MVTKTSGAGLGRSNDGAPQSSRRDSARNYMEIICAERHEIERKVKKVHVATTVAVTRGRFHQRGALLMMMTISYRNVAYTHPHILTLSADVQTPLKDIFVLSLLQHYLILLVCYSDSVVVLEVALLLRPL